MSWAPQKFSAADIVVIVTLWALQFWDMWLSSLVIHSSDVIFGELKESEFFKKAHLYIFISKCLSACALAVIVDAYNHKYAVAFGGMCLCALTPVLGLMMCITEKRESFVWAMCSSSLLFVTSPAAFGVIFSQKQQPVRIQVRRLVSIMEFVQGIQLVMIGEVIPENASHSKQNSMVACWVAVVPFIIFIITILDRLRAYVRPEALRERGVVSIFKGIRHDVSGKSPKTGLSKSNVLVFIFLLLPAFSITILGTVISNLKPNDDTQFQHPSLKRIASAAQLTVIPITEVFLSYAPLKELVGELLVLGLAHVLNILVLTVLCFKTLGIGTHRSTLNQYQLLDNHSLHNLAITTEYTPLSTFDRSASSPQLIQTARDKRALPAGRFQFIIVNHSYRDLVIKDPHQTLFTGSIQLFRQVGAFCPVNTSTISGEYITVNLSITAEGTRLLKPIMRNQTVTFRDKMFRYVGISGNDDNLAFSLGGDDVDIPQFLDPSVMMLVVQNTIVGRTYFGQFMKTYHHEIEINTSTGSPLALELLPHYSKSLTLVIQAPKVDHEHIITIRYMGRDPNVKLSPTPFYIPAYTPFQVVIISYGIILDEPQYVERERLIYIAKPPPKTPPPFTPDEPDAVVGTSFAVFGTILGMTTVGYIHFFWMGAPVRLRTTLYAWFIVSNELLGWITSRIIGHEVGFKEAISLLSIATATAIWHFVFGWYYDSKIMPAALLRRQRSEPRRPP